MDWTDKTMRLSRIRVALERRSSRTHRGWGKTSGLNARVFLELLSSLFGGYSRDMVRPAVYAHAIVGIAKLALRCESCSIHTASMALRCRSTSLSFTGRTTTPLDCKEVQGRCLFTLNRYA